jgi:hypothetical protein
VLTAAGMLLTTCPHPLPQQPPTCVPRVVVRAPTRCAAAPCSAATSPRSCASSGSFTAAAARCWDSCRSRSFLQMQVGSLEAYM